MKFKTLFPVLFLFGAAGTLVGCNGGGHTHNYGDLVSKVDPTCVEDGHEAYYHCDGCNKYFNENKEEKTLEELTIAALGHDWQKVTGQSPTCTEDGYKDYYDCSRCDLYAEDPSGTVTFTDLEAWKKGKGKLDAAHDLEWVDGRDETCLADGWEGYYECQICGDLFEDEDALFPIENLEKWKIDPNGGLIKRHVNNLDLNTQVDASCLWDGHKSYYSCSVCDKCYKDSAGTEPIEDIDEWLAGEGKLPKHVDALTLVPGTAKTCDTDGYKDAYKCDKCGKYYEDENALFDIGDQDAYNAWIADPEGGKIPKSHELTEHPAVPATGFNPGNTLYYSCEDCGKYFSDAAGTNEIAEDSWITEPLKTVTFDSVEQFNANTSKEGDTFNLEKYNLGTEDGYICSLEQGTGAAPTQYDGYVVFDNLHGISELSVKGVGMISVRNGTAVWEWKNYTSFLLKGNDEYLTIKLDPERYNSLYIASYSGRTLIKEIKIKTTLEDATGSTDGDLLQTATISQDGSSANTYGYFTASDTYNSKSSLVAGATGNSEGWLFVFVDFSNPLDVQDYDLKFEAKSIIGHKRFSMTPIYANGGTATEVGWDITNDWTTYSYDTNTNPLSTPISRLRITVWTSNVSSIHEFVIDNLRLDKSNIVTETGSAAWSYRAFDSRDVLLETDYANKAVAIDFKPETDSAAFEIDFMSDNNTYVGRKNYITVTDKVPTSTFGTITQKGDGWYTLTVSSYNICADARFTNGTINGIYIATINPMTGSVTFDYRSIRVVDDVAPTRITQTITNNEEGIGINDNTNLNDIMNVGQFRSNLENEILVSLKVEGDIGSKVYMNFATANNTMLHTDIELIVTDDGLSTNFGRLNKALDDGWYNFIIKASDCDNLEIDSPEKLCSVYWCSFPDQGRATSITFDKASLHIYAPGILA